MPKKMYKLLLSLLLSSYADVARAATFEKLGASVSKVLMTGNAFTDKVRLDDQPVEIFYSKHVGEIKDIAVVQRATYPPDYTHTWVIEIDPTSFQVGKIRVVEMSCPHAFPTNRESFLEQYKGAGPADLKTLHDKVNVIAKATGSSNLLTEGVIRSIKAARMFMKKHEPKAAN
jgi:hypothetical protein